MAQVFEGITVLDFTSGMPGGVATMVMSDFGAEVIKVVPPQGEKFAEFPGALQWNRGKKSVVLDLKSPQGRNQAQRLARNSDVVVESFRPGVTERLGIDYERLRVGHPALVYATLTVEIVAVTVKCSRRTGPEPPAAQGAVGASSSSFTVTLAELVVPTV